MATSAFQIRIQPQAVLASIRQAMRRYPKVVEIGLIYQAHYGVIVHETPRPPHSANYTGVPGTGQSKFLERPARDPQVQAKMLEVIESKLRQKRGFQHALTWGMNVLLKASRELVPVKTGNLYRSAEVVKLNVTTT